MQDYTIEHIMPQNDDLKAQRRADLGENWKRIHEQYHHTLGKFMLTGYNLEYSDRCFTEKRDIPGGFKESPLCPTKPFSVTQSYKRVDCKRSNPGNPIQ